MPASTREARRIIDERHPIAGWLYRAAGLPANGTVVLEFPGDPVGARRAATALAGFRRKGRLGPPGSFDPTPRDPNGEGVGYFDRIVISQRGTDVWLKHLPDGLVSLRTNAIDPANVYVLDPVMDEEPGSCSHVNPEDFDVVTG